MTLLATVLRGLRARALLSAGSVLLVALAVGSAVLGPQFAQSVTSSFLVSRLGDAPAELSALSWTFTPDAQRLTGPDRLDAVVDGAVAATGDVVPPGSRDLFPPPDHAIVVSARSSYLQAQWALLALAGDDVCDHLQVQGRCPERRGEVLLLEGDAALTGKGVGAVLDLPDLGTVTVVGTYAAPGPAEEDFWVSPGRFASLAPNAQTGEPYTPAPLVTLPVTLLDQDAASLQVLVDRPLALSPDLTVADLPRLSAAGAALAGGTVTVEGGSLTGSPVNDLPAIADEVRGQQSTARSSIAPAVISVVLVALALLLRLLTAAADLRLPELALASLRGVPRRRMWRLGLAEPLVLLVLAVPVGAALGLGSAWLLVRAWLVPGLPLVVPLTAVLAGVAVALATAGVAVVAVGLVLRLPLSDQLTGVRRPRPTGLVGLVVELVLVAAAVAVLVSKLSAPGPGDPDVTDLVLPVLLAVVAGLAASRLSVLVARWWTRRSGRSLTTYVASRAVSRRQEGSLVVLPVTAAIAICVFGAGVYSSAGTWRASVAATEAPAPVLWSSGQGLAGTVDLTHRVDPDGQWLMAASTLSSQGPSYAVLDTERLARVGDWQAQWTPGTSAAEITALLAPPAEQPVLSGSAVSLTVDRDTDAGEDLYVRLRLSGGSAGAGSVGSVGSAGSAGSDGGGEPAYAFLGPYGLGRSTATAALPGCAAGCTLEAITLGRRAALPLSITGDVRLSDLVVDGAPVAGAFRGAGWQSSTATQVDDATDVVTGVEPDGADGADGAGGDGLLVGLDAPEPAIAQLTSGDVPDRLPVVRGVDARLEAAPGSSSTTSVLDVDLDPVLTARSVPLLGPVGVLIDYRTFSTGRTLYEQDAPVYVLARADTPGAVTEQLRAQGLTVATTQAAQRRLLDNSAYALALRLYAVVAGLVLLMALAGLFVSTAVQLPSRRRDAAALRVVGVPRRTVGAGVVVELGFVLGATAVAGLLAGSLAQYVVLRTVTLGYAEDITTPALVAALDPVRLLVLAAAAAVLFGAVALASALLVVRGARGATLRENAR